MMLRTRGLIDDKRLILLSFLFLLFIRISYSFNVNYLNTTQGSYVKCYFFTYNHVINTNSLNHGVINYLCFVFNKYSTTIVYKRNVNVNDTLNISFSSFSNLDEYSVPNNVQYILVIPPLSNLSFVIPVHGLNIIYASNNLYRSIYTISFKYNTINILQLPYTIMYTKSIKILNCPNITVLKLVDSSGINYTTTIHTYGTLVINYNIYPSTGLYVSFNNSLFIPIYVFNSSTGVIKVNIIPFNKTMLKINNIKIPIKKSSIVYLPCSHVPIYVNNRLILFSRNVKHCSILVSKNNKIYHNCVLETGSPKISIIPEITNNATMATIEISTPILFTNVNIRVILDNITIFNETKEYLYGTYKKIIPIPGGIRGKHHYCVLVNINNIRSIGYCKDINTPVYNPTVLVSFDIHNIPLGMVIFFWIMATSIILIIITKTKKYFE